MPALSALHRPQQRRRRRWQGCLLSWVLWWFASAVSALTLEVTVTGVTGAERRNVLAQLGIYQERSDRDLTPARLDHLHRLAPAQIRDALIPFGFYQTQLDATLQQHGDRWQARYHITPGAPVTISTVDYQLSGEGATDPIFPVNLPLRRGDILQHSAYEAAKAQVRACADRAGYKDAHWLIHQVRVDPTTNHAAVQLHLATGSRHFLGPVTFQSPHLDVGLLQRYVTFPVGALYTSNRLIQLQSRLLSSDYFRSVELIPQPTPPSSAPRIPITVVTTPSLPNHYRLGLGYASDLGPRLRLDWQRRYLNRWGHRLRTALSLAPAESTLALDYRIPLHDPTRDYLSIKPQFSVTEETALGSGWTQTLQIAHISSTASGWRRSLGVDYRYEDFKGNGHDLGATNELVPTVSWAKTITDDPLLTQHGYRLKYSLLGGLEGVLAEATYLSGELQYKGIQAFAAHYRLIVRGDLGVTLTPAVRDLPLSRRFYAGGDQSLRGWGFGTLGPRADDNRVSGGRYLAVGSIELERQLAGRWSSALFTDFGNAFDRLNAPAPELSAGIGVRWASPLGQIRCDLAFALSEDRQRRGIPPARLHLVIGPDL